MKFKYPLRIQLMTNAAGIPLFNRGGMQLWQVMQYFSFSSEVTKTEIIVPRLFVTDFASVPKIPLVYEALGGIAQMPAVIHDYLYSTGQVSRELADRVLLEAMTATEVPWLKRQLIYAGVRVGGGSHYAHE